MMSLAIAALAIFLATSIVWFCFSVGIPPMPSSPKVCRAMVDAVCDARGNGPIIDLGSGLGTLAIALARRYPQRQVIGYEVSWVPWFAAMALKRLLRLDNLTFRRQDFLHAPWPADAVLLCYLFRSCMQQIEHKLEREGCRPVLLISNTFALPACRPERTIRLRDLYRTHIHVYRWPPTMPAD